MHAYGHVVGAPHCPLAVHVSTCVSLVHCVAPGVHVPLPPSSPPLELPPELPELEPLLVPSAPASVPPPPLDPLDDDPPLDDPPPSLFSEPLDVLDEPLLDEALPLDEPDEALPLAASGSTICRSSTPSRPSQPATSTAPMTATIRWQFTTSPSRRSHRDRWLGSHLASRSSAVPKA
jgi:hypothetical protein